MRILALLVDGLNLVRRIYAAVPGEEGSTAHADGVLQSCSRSLQRALAREAPTHALCAFEESAASWRHQLLPAYKAGRPPMPAPLVALLPHIEDAFAAAGVRPLRVPGFEADDVLATLAAGIAAHAGEVVILSTDKSMLTLLRPGIRVRNHFDERDLDAAYVRQRFGVAPERLATWLALVGERSQGIPGVKSIGARTATDLVQAHGDLESILAAAAAGMPGRAGRALREGTDDARLSLRLATLRTDVHVGMSLRDFRLES